MIQSVLDFFRNLLERPDWMDQLVLHDEGLTHDDIFHDLFEDDDVFADLFEDDEIL